MSDNTNEPLIGATVMVKGTNNGVATDIDGNYALMVKNGDVLVVSYVGYTTQEVKVTGQKTQDIILSEDTANLEEVVVVGYGTMKKKDLTGAVTQINPDKMADRTQPQCRTCSKVCRVFRWATAPTPRVAARSSSAARTLYMTKEATTSLF